jgi:PEP-CTERM motif
MRRSGSSKKRRGARTALVAVVLGSILGSIDRAQAVPFAGTLYATDARNGNLLTVNTSTGAGTVMGQMGFPAPSLAMNSGGTLYAGEGRGNPNIYTVNPSNGSTTFVGSTGLGYAAVGALEFDARDTLYASVNLVGDGGSGSDHLATIDTSTGAATVIGSFGSCTGVAIPTDGGGSCAIDGMEAIAFDGSGALWGALRTSATSAGAAGLYQIDPGTGAASFVTSILEGSSPVLVVSLQFAIDGTLFGGTANGRLVTIDTSTGAATTIGIATGGNSLGGLAGRAVPEPGTAPLLGLGLAGLARRRRSRSVYRPSDFSI